MHRFGAHREVDVEMEKTVFLRSLDEMLELDPGTLTGNEMLADLDMWDSLAIISFIALVDEQYGIVVEGERLAQARTIDDLMGLVTEKLAA